MSITRMGHTNAIYDPDRDARSNMSNYHYHSLMREWDFRNMSENDESVVENRYRHTDFYYNDGDTSVQKKSIVDLGYFTVTVPAHCWNDETPFAELLFHGYYSASNPRRFVRAVLLDVEILKTIQPCGKRTNWKTNTEFYYWAYERVVPAIVNTYNVEESSW